MKTYECSICHEINSSNRLHCKSCGTIPAMYSFLRKEMSLNASQVAVYTVAAFGCDRAESHRTVRGRLRTVPADYYAEE